MRNLPYLLLLLVTLGCYPAEAQYRSALYRKKHPEIFQGVHQKKNYFEGWYFKNVTASGQETYSIIPGVAFDKKKKGHAFIQVIHDGSTETLFIPFPLSDFHYDKNIFQISIGKNRFSAQEMWLDIDTLGLKIRAHLTYSGLHPLEPTSWRTNGTMGWFTYLPFMQCQHGMLSMQHRITGELIINSKRIDFTGGKGYTEKDWGRSMPDSWVWIQANHFTDSNLSFMISVAKIPYLGMHFTGFLCMVMHDDTIYKFTTFTHAKIRTLYSGNDTVHILIKDKARILEISARQCSAGVLKAPEQGSMKRDISESIDAEVRVRMHLRNGREVFDENTRRGGMEVVGKLPRK